MTAPGWAHHGIGHRHGGRWHITLAAGATSSMPMRATASSPTRPIIEAAPDVILMMDRGGAQGTAPTDLTTIPAIASTPAGAEGRYHPHERPPICSASVRERHRLWRDLAASLHAETVGE